VLDGDPVPFALLNELRLALVQPIVSKPRTRTSLRTAATPARTPKSPKMPLAISEPRAAPAVGIVVVGQLSRIADVGFVAVERPCRPHVDGAGGAAFDHARQRALVHRQLGEQFTGEEVEVDFAVGVLRVGAAG
jgi:hypothetical protein